MSGKVCAQCSHYIGAGDWDMCCNQKDGPRLCYEDTSADECPNFNQTSVCKNRTSHLGMFRCSICNHFAREDEVGKTCPSCGRTIVGAMWNEQKHFYAEGI